jgi:hypothetical protein
MFRKFTFAIFALVPLSLLSQAQTNVVIPTANTNTPGTVGFSTYGTSARSYQWLMDSTLLTTLLNDTISGISFRGVPAATTAWPTSTVTINNFDLYLGKAVLVQNATAVFATNQIGTQTQVRSGSLVIDANSFPSGNSWGPVINFNAPFVYTGGNLSLLLRYDGFTGIGKSTDALATTSSGYNSLYKATYEAGYTSTGTTAGNFAILKFTSSTSPLPVTLLSFNCAAQGEDAEIRWESASENNIRNYVIERGNDGIHFDAIQTQPAQGQSDGVTKYQYTDVGIFNKNETVFYRLKIVEDDGTFKYSNINKISNGKVQETKLIVYSNPVKSICNVSYTLSTDTEVAVLVYDFSGKLVGKESVNGSKGNNGMFMDFSKLHDGQYVLKLVGSGIDDSFKFIKE